MTDDATSTDTSASQHVDDREDDDREDDDRKTAVREGNDREAAVSEDAPAGGATVDPTASGGDCRGVDGPPDPTAGDARDLGAGLFEDDMGPSSSLAHLYRGEIHRMKFWRERLDRTTNWAVTTMAAILTFSFSSPDHPHYLLLAGAAMFGIFLVIEARRYRGYDVWRSRVRVLQENVIAHGLNPREAVRDERWRERLAEDYRDPKVKISAEEALAHRLRRVYLPLFSVLVVAWVLRVTVMATVAWSASAAIGSVPGRATTGLVVLAYAALFAVSFRPRTWHAEAELRTEDLTAWDDRQ